MISMIFHLVKLETPPFEYTLTDSDGATDVATVTVTVSGTNDAPNTFGTIPPQASVDSTTIVPLDVSGFFVDPDSSGALVFDDAGTLPQGLSIDASSGVITGTLSSSASQNSTYSVTIVATDPAGATAIQSFDWTVTNPTPTAIDDAFATLQDTVLSGNVITINNGSGIDFDSDGDMLTVQSVNGDNANVGVAVIGSNGGEFSIHSDGSFTFDTLDDFDDLPDGSTRVSTVTYSIVDADGAQSSATVSVTVTGTNDDPIVVTSIPDQSDVELVAINPVDLSVFFSDADNGSSLAFDDSGSLPPGLILNNLTGVVTGTPAANASQGGPYVVTISVDDGQGGIVSASFTWDVVNPTPVARDDVFNTIQGGSLSGSVFGDNGNGVDFDPDGDLITVDAVNGDDLNVGAVVVGSAGGEFTIDSNGDFVFDAQGDFDDLGAGETRVTEVTYTITDGQGGFGSATVSVTVTGTNDSPTALGTIPDQSDIDGEAGISLDVSGYFVDLDSNDSLTFDAAGTLPIGLSIHPMTGLISGTIDTSASLTSPYLVTITATDSSGVSASQSFTWEVNNLLPQAFDNQITVDEISLTTGNVISDGGAGSTDFDPDGDSLVISAVNGSAGNIGIAIAGSGGGTFAIQSDGSYSFDTGNDFVGLTAGQTSTTSVTYSISDGDGGFSTATLTVTVTGQTGQPIAVGTIPDQTGVDGTTAANLNVAAFFSDPDTGDVLTYSASGTLPTGLSIDSTTGEISGTYSSVASVGSPHTVVITASDSTNQTATQSFSWTVTNPAPTATNDDLTTNENTTINGNIISEDNGAGFDTDPDGDALSVVEVDGSASNVGVPVTGSAGGGFTILANGDYVFDPGTDFDSLAPGDTAVTTTSYTLVDAQGATSSATITVTITGTNDSPNPVGSIGDQTGVDATAIAPLDVSGFFTDTDAGDVLTFSDNGSLPPGLSIDTNTGVISGSYPADASVGSPYVVSITATDSNGGTTTQSFTWIVTNPGPSATDNDYLTDQNTSITSNIISVDTGDGLDSDIDGDSVSVIAVNGNSGAVGQAIQGSSGGEFIIHANGLVTFDPNGDFVHLPNGATQSTQITYTLSDGQGGSDTAVVTVLVTGLDDGPRVLQSLPPQTDPEATPIESVDLSNFIVPGDTGDTITFDDGGTLPPGLVIDSTTGVVTGIPEKGTADIGDFSVTITAADQDGQTVSASFTWKITGAFAFDSFRDLSEEDKQAYRDDVDTFYRGSEVLLSRVIDRLAPEPILAGWAQPGAILVGKIYDADGSLIGESSLTVGISGNWTMHFFGTRMTPNARVAIEHISTDSIAVGQSGLKLADETYRALELSVNDQDQTTPSTIVSESAGETLRRNQEGNSDPLGLQ